MNTTVTDVQNDTLSLTRDFNASREKLFQAWTDPKILTQWFGPKGVSTESAQVDLKIGGQYQFTMKEPDGKIHSIGGRFREIDPPNKLVYTWILDGQGCGASEGLYAETVVTIEFQDLGTATRLILTHDFLPSKESKEGHAMGWNGSLDCLETVLA